MTAAMTTGLGICPGCKRRMVVTGPATVEIAVYHSRGLCTRCVHTTVVAALFLRPDASHWLPRAACTAPSVDPAWFYPHDWEPATLARQVCRRCPVTRECLADALETKDAFGVRGGFTPQERATLARLGVGQ